MKSNKNKIWIGFLFLVLAGAAFYLWKKNSKAPEVFRPVKVDRGDIEITVMATGTVQPQNRLEIKPPIPGRVETVLVQEGQAVRKGQVLAWMSSSERAALLDAARAKGSEELKKWEDLYKATPIIAPINGTIIQRAVESGQSFISTDPILVMSDRLTIKAQVDETDLALIKLKQPADIVLDAYSQEAFPGEVVQIAYEATTVNNVTTYIVYILPKETPDYMRSGMTANVIFKTEQKQGVLRVPNEVLRTQDGRTEVMVQNSGQDRRWIPVETGITDGKYTEVVSGLEEAQTVLVKVLSLEDNTSSNPLQPKINRRGRKK